MRKLSNLIQLNKYTNQIQSPSLKLMSRTFEMIGKISKYTNWNASFVGNGLDEISFEVRKYNNGEICPVWDDLIDFKIIDVDGYKRFEIQVDYTDSTETVKSIHGVSLETELGQLYLHEFHVNDEEATGAEITEYNSVNFDDDGNFIPTVFYDVNDPDHSLLHRALKDKAPHWTIRHVPDYIAFSEDEDAELSSEFQRTYTIDGETIYDFFTGTVAEESNVIFIFDTVDRAIDVYSLSDGYINGEKVLDAIGEDTTVFVSKKKLANEISISSNKDSMKNCFRVEGGDDIITDMIRAVNMNGSNYIYQFADFQYNDMPYKLSDAIKEYQAMMSDEDVKDEYYGENGIFTRLCAAYEELSYLQSEMMPSVSIEYPETAQAQYEILKEELESMVIGVISVNNYSNSLFAGITNNIEAMANIIIDSRYSLEIISDTVSYDGDAYKWTGTIQVTRVSDETDYYPKSVDGVFTETMDITVADDNTDDSLPYTRQKIDKALAKGEIWAYDIEINDEIEDMSEEEITEYLTNYFNQYCLNRLQSFVDGYDSCLSVLTNLNTDSDIKDTLYDMYYIRWSIANKILQQRTLEVSKVEESIVEILQEQAEFQAKYDFVTFLEDREEGLYNQFCMYRREDTYLNSNYISDGLETTSEIIEKAQELMQVAEKEIKKACVLQRTVSCSLNNLFAMKEFEPLYDSFDLFNYIRIQTDDEILKLRLIGVDISGDTLSDIDVTFSEQIETVDGNMTDLESIIQQAASIASSYSSTVLQAKQGSKAQNTFLEMYNSGLNAANMMLKNSDNNEVTMTSSGILCKRMDDEGFYGNKQLRIIGNGIYMTEDAWQTLSMAIGEINFNGKDMYGIIAEAIVGEMIVGNNLIIGNDNNVIIDSDGITIYDGKYTEETAQKVFYADTEGNLNLEAYIYAKGGKIGGLNVDENSLSYSINSYASLPVDVNESSKHYYEDVFTISSSGIVRLYLDESVNKFYVSYKYPCTTWDSNVTATTFSISGYAGDNNSPYTSSTYAKYLYYYNIPYNDEEVICYNKNFYYHISTSFIEGSSSEDDGIIAIPSGCKYGRYKYILNTKKDGSGNYLYLWSEIGIYGDGVSPDGNYNYIPPSKLKQRIENAIENIIIFLTEEELSDAINFFEINKDEFKMGKALSYNLMSDTLLLQNISDNISPKIDGFYSVGTSALRWSTVYSTSGTISTSDRNKKKDINYDLNKYIQLFDMLKPCSFRFINGNRIHIGYIAQDVEEAMKQLGITDMEFGGFCKDILPDGTVIYSLRYDEFEGIYHAKINQQQLEIDALKESVSFLIQEINELKKEKED